MPRQRRKPKWGPAWYQALWRKVPRILGQPQSFPISSLSPTSTSSLPDLSPSSSSGQHDLTPLSSSKACRVEWFDNHGNSLSFEPSAFQDFPTTSHPSSPPTTPLLASLLSTTSIPSATTPSQPPPPFCCACGDFSWLLAALENLQSLVFDVQHDMVDLIYRTEFRDRHEERMEALIDALLNHSSAPSTATTTTAPATSDIGKKGCPAPNSK